MEEEFSKHFNDRWIGTMNRSSEKEDRQTGKVGMIYSVR